MDFVVRMGVKEAKGKKKRKAKRKMLLTGWHGDYTFYPSSWKAEAGRYL